MNFYGRFAMVFLRSFILVIIPLCGICFTQTTGMGPSADVRDQAEIRRLMNEISDAFVVRNAAPFEKIYADDFISVRGRPIYNSKQQLVAMMRADSALLKARKRLDFETIAFTNEEPDIRIFGDIAVATVLKNNEWQFRGSTCLTKYQATEVWQRHGSTWRLIAGSANTFQCSPVPWHPPHPAVAAIGDVTDPPLADPAKTETVPEDLTAMLAKVSAVEQARLDDALKAYFSWSYVSTDTNGERSNSGMSLIQVFRSAAEPSQRQSIDLEHFKVLGSSAIYTFRLRTRGRLGTTDRGSSVFYLAALVKNVNGWQFVASHAVPASVQFETSSG